ncbi:MAG: glucosaminidase domain-containing protein [Candidatus Cryptobacteroides sp.]
MTASLMTVLPLIAAPDSPQRKYIAQYADMAVSEMYRSGVPASITLAQGMLESRNGESPLAAKGNNHFGIKCHNTWEGGKMYYDDDRKGECFRKYKSADESFRDHSDFLRYRDRYKFLFDLKTTDYKGWAYGLKKAGYATDPAYPQKLIKLIEDYQLYKYDTMSADAAVVVPDETSSEAASSAEKDKKTVEKKSSGEKKSSKHTKASKKRRKNVQTIPESPHQMEQAQPLDKEKQEVFRLQLTRKIYSQNGVPFIYSMEGETYESIAKQHNLFTKELLKFNDLSHSEPLAPGTVVYLQAKKKQTRSGLDKYVCEGGENLRDIAQRYAVRLSSIVKLNSLDKNTPLREGDVLKLRK